MTINTLKKRQYILVAVAFILFLGVFYKYSPLSGGGGDEIEDARKKIVKYQRMSVEKEMLREKLMELGKQVAKNENGLLNGTTPALAAVSLQNKLADIAGRSGITISSQRVMKPPKNKEDEKTPYIEIPVQITMTITLRQLEEMLYNIAASPIFLRVNNASLKVLKSKDLQTNITVSGLMPSGEV